MIFSTPELDEKELTVLAEVESLRNRLGYMLSEPRRWTGLLRRVALAKAIQGSNTIEGHNITVDDAIAAVAGEEPQDASTEDWRAILGCREAMTYVLSMGRELQFSYSSDRIKSLHFMMMNHDLDKAPGQWRPGVIFVRRGQEVIYEGADVERVPALMEELVAELNGAAVVPPIVKAAMAHLNLAMIHPFKDGNGRMARCLQSLVLARSGALSPVFASIEEYLGHNTTDYYQALESVGGRKWSPTAVVRPWIRFCLTAHYRQATTFLRRNERIGAIWTVLESEVERRGLPERTALALTDAALGYRVRNPFYRQAAEITTGLAGRDLKTLVSAGLLIPRGEKRGRYYVASPILEAIRRDHPIQKVVDDPFSEVQPRLPGL